MNLDDMLTRKEAAAWLRLSERQLVARTLGRRPKIPAFRLSRECLLFHPRTIIAKLATDAGVAPEIIQTSLCIPKHPIDKGVKGGNGF
jgi:hypothetical protein